MGVSKSTPFVKGRLITFLESGEFSDTLLIVGKEEKKMKVHKLLLMTSEYFYKKLKEFPQFGGPTQSAVTAELAALDLNTETGPTSAILVWKSDDPGFELEIRIPYLEANVMELYLQFLYVGGLHLSLVEVSFEDAVHLFRAAKLFEDSRLLADTRSIFDLFLSAKLKNLLTAFELAIEFDEMNLTKKCLELICRDANVLVKDPIFLQLKPECLAVLLQNDELQVESELQLFQAVLQWGQEECKRRNLNYEDKTDVKLILEPLIKHLRFPMMTPEEFSREIPISKVLSSDAVVEVLVYFSRPDDEKEKTDSVGGFTTRARNYLRTCRMKTSDAGSSTTSAVLPKEPQSSRNHGTSLMFIPLAGIDTVMEKSRPKLIITRHQCITCMSAYENKSLEELRMEDYRVGHNKVRGNTNATLFSSPLTATNTAQSCSFGQNASCKSPIAFTFSKPPPEASSQSTVGLFGAKGLTSPAPVHTEPVFASSTPTNAVKSFVGAVSPQFTSTTPFLFEKSCPTNKSSATFPLRRVLGSKLTTDERKVSPASTPNQAL